MTMPRIAALLALALIAQLFCSAPARAATDCTATMTNLTFGSVDPSGTTDVTATLNYHCHTNVAISLLSTATVQLCFSIGAGSQSGSTVGARLMRNAFADPLGFQMSRNSTHTNSWGNTVITNTHNAPLTYNLVSILGLFAEGDGFGSATLYGRVPAQAGAAAGTFTSSFGVDTTITYRYRDSLLTSTPTTCVNGGIVGTPHTFPFTASAVVPEFCAVFTATDLDFGNNPGAISANRDYTSLINLTCRNRTTWNLSLNNGLYASGNVRRMRQNIDGIDYYVSYELYRDTGRTLRWGSTVGTDTVPGSSTGVAQTQTVFGRAPAPQSVPAGSYSDTITATITY